MRPSSSDLRDDWYPHLTFGTGAEKTTRFFPDKLPIGVPLKGRRRHVFLYLATREVPADFRVFLLRHADLLKSVDEWTIRVLLPRRFRKAAALYRYAVRDAFLMPLDPTARPKSSTGIFGRVGARSSARRQTAISTSRRPLESSARHGSRRCIACGNSAALTPSGRCRARPSETSSNAGEGRIEFAELRHQYLQLTPLVGTCRRG